MNTYCLNSFPATNQWKFTTYKSLDRLPSFGNRIIFECLSILPMEAKYQLRFDRGHECVCLPVNGLPSSDDAHSESVRQLHQSKNSRTWRTKLFFETMDLPTKVKSQHRSQSPLMSFGSGLNRDFNVDEVGSNSASSTSTRYWAIFNRPATVTTWFLHLHVDKTITISTRNSALFFISCGCDRRTIRRFW
jgi:hypothetical protein